MITDLFMIPWNMPGLVLKAWLLTYAIHSTILLTAVWIFTTLFRATTHLVKELLWKVAVIGGMITAAFQLGLNFEPFAGRLDASSLLTPQEMNEPESGLPPVF